ncbi:MAG: hypothetical protein LR015_09075 [Verrucomicrobia bacterium]|nr:hypothetical protein [Verrucomicrobiota bacterium]
MFKKLLILMMILAVQGVNARPDRDERERWDREPTGRWVAELTGDVAPEQLAQELGVRFAGYMGNRDWGLVVFEPLGPLLLASLPPGLEGLERLPEGLLWLEREEWQTRAHRSTPTHEPLFGQQWHWRNSGQRGGLPGVDANIVPVLGTRLERAQCSHCGGGFRF